MFSLAFGVTMRIAEKSVVNSVNSQNKARLFAQNAMKIEIISALNAK